MSAPGILRAIVGAAGGGGGIVSKVIDHTWTGNNANNRVIDLGDDYDFILIIMETNKGPTSRGPGLFWALWTAHGGISDYTGSYAQTFAGTGADTMWQGKLTGGNANKIQLGSTGSLAWGTNCNGYVYRLIGFKFSAVE